MPILQVSDLKKIYTTRFGGQQVQADEGPGHGNPLLLAAGDLVGVLLQQGIDAQPPGQGQAAAG